MKFSNPSAILNPGETGQSSSLLPGAGGDDFLSRVNITLQNFKELLNMFKELRDITGNQADEGEPGMPRSQPGQSGVVQFVQLLIENGYGDTPIGDLFDQIRPHTIKQILGVIKSAGLKR